MSRRRTLAGLAGLLALAGISAGCGGTSVPSGPGVTTTSGPTTTVAAPANPLLSYQAHYAHFAADFPGVPKDTFEPASIGGDHLQIYVAAAQSGSGPFEVAEEDVTPALPADQSQAALVSALKSVTATSGLSITSQPAPTAYRSYDAYVATYSNGGSTTLRGISFVADGGSRLYILIGPTDVFSAFAASLRLTP